MIRLNPTQKLFMQTCYRNINTTARVVDTRYSLVSDRAVVVRDLSGDKYPELKLTLTGPSIILHGHLTVN